jgi:hypothetical protein
MSVRRRTQTYANGRTSKRLIVDIEYRHKDGTIQRLRRKPMVQAVVLGLNLPR